MKIILWPTMYFPNIGGLEKMTHSLACTLQKRGHEVAVITNSEKQNHYFIDGISVHSFPFIEALFKYRLPEIVQILKCVDQLLEIFAPEVVNIHGWYECFSFYQIRALEKKSVPISLTIHGLLEQKSYETENCLKLWHRAQAVNSVSKASAPSIPHPFIQTIWNGLPLSPAPIKPLPKNRLLLAGRLSTEKCFDVAFYAFKLLLPKYPDLTLTLVGDGPEYEKLLELKKNLNLPIEMPGFVPPEEIESYIDRSTLIVIPSSYESFSLVALEAALRARPVIASRVMGLQEVVSDCETGLLVEPNSPEILAEAIDSLLKDPKKMGQMGKNGQKRAHHLYNIENTANQYLSMYEQASHLYRHSSP